MDPYFTPLATPLSHTFNSIRDKIRDAILRPQKTTVHLRGTERPNLAISVKGTPAVSLPFAVDAWLAAPPQPAPPFAVDAWLAAPPQPAPQPAPPQPAPIGYDNEAFAAAFSLYCALAARAGFNIQGHQFGMFLAACAALNARRDQNQNFPEN